MWTEGVKFRDRLIFLTMGENYFCMFVCALVCPYLVHVCEHVCGDYWLTPSALSRECQHVLKDSSLLALELVKWPGWPVWEARDSPVSLPSTLGVQVYVATQGQNPNINNIFLKLLHEKLEFSSSDVNVAFDFSVFSSFNPKVKTTVPVSSVFFKSSLLCL